MRDIDLTARPERLAESGLSHAEKRRGHGLPLLLNKVAKGLLMHGISSFEGEYNRRFFYGQYRRLFVPITAGHIVAAMKKDRKKPLTPEERAECAALKALWDLEKGRRKITQEEMAANHGMSQPAVGHYLNGRNRLNLRVAQAFASYLGAHIADFSDRLADEQRQLSGAGGSFHVAEEPAEYGAPSEDEYALIPQYDARAAAGDGCLNDHVQLKGGLAFKREWLRRLGLKPENLQVIYAEGDSMADTIMDGEVMLVDCVDREPRSGKIYAILRPDGGVSVKRLIQKSVTGTWMVASDNPDKRRYPDEDATAEVLHEIPIIGRVAWRGGGL